MRSRFPKWNRDGKELYFATTSGNLLMVAVTTKGPDIEFEKPVLLYDGVSTTTQYPNRPFDVAPDGKRFLVIKDDPSHPIERPELRMVVNWIEDVRSRMDAGN